MYLKTLALFGLFLLADALDNETNGSRLKRGLPPLPPRFLARSKPVTGVKSDLFHSFPIICPASPTISAKPSYTQLSTRSTRIQVFAGNGSSLGYVKNSTPTLGINLDTDPGPDLRVQAVNREPFGIAFENPNFLRAPLYSGALASNDLDFTESSNANQARATKGLVRSAFWSIDSNTKELTALYVGSAGTKSPILAFDAVANTLHFVRNIDIYNAANDDFPVIPVKFYLSED
ncbi:hypothetical protein K438DRAFT_1953434 [Mycena galopus ATCC 62051]|nr:hypothetical protein K438DRAFT_1953434 [Mycena galopus ATCC 62051]